MTRATRPQLIFECSEGLLVLEGDASQTETELLAVFHDEQMVFGDPPYRITVREVHANEARLTAGDLRRRLAVAS